MVSQALLAGLGIRRSERVHHYGHPSRHHEIRSRSCFEMDDGIDWGEGDRQTLQRFAMHYRPETLW